VDALCQVIGGLPSDFPGIVLVVLHIAPIGPSVLPSILARHSHLPAVHPRDGEPLRKGWIYVAPPDRHLVVTNDEAHVVLGPRENGNRPAADPLFRSVAMTFGERSAGVILSGALGDGTAGLMAIKRAGGLTIAQDPDEAMFPGMPTHAITHVGPDKVAELKAIPGLLIDFAERMSATVGNEAGRSPGDDGGDELPSQPPSAITCPECGGSLWVTSDEPLRFRCRVGHAFSAESLFMAKRDALEAALWAAVVALEERADLSRRLLKRVRHQPDSRRGHRYRLDIEQSEERVSLLKRIAAELITSVQGLTEVDDGNLADGAD
jgi:two-component system chemotaxis response regulator CheB